MAWADYWNDWSASDKLMMAPVRPIALALTTALNERLLVTGRTEIDLDMAATMEPNKLLRTVASYLRDDAGADPIWQYFCESQTASDGIFTSGSVPAYTASSIIYHTDADLPTFLTTVPADRFRFIIGDPLTAAACWRMRQTIDACTWQRTVSQASGYPADYNFRWCESDLSPQAYLTYKSAGAYSDWADVVSNWPANYTTTPYGNAQGLYGYGDFFLHQGSYKWGGNRAIAHCAMFPYTTDFDYDADLYLYVRPPYKSGTPFAGTFDGEGVWPSAGKHYTMTIAGKNGDALFDLQNTLPSGVPPAPDVTFYASETGNPAGTYSGAITSITIDFSSDPGEFYPTGNIYLENAAFESDYFAYSAVSGSGTSRTFTVSTTLDYSYTATDDASAYSGESNSGEASAGWQVYFGQGGLGGDCYAVSKWDASDNAGFQFRSDT